MKPIFVSENWLLCGHVYRVIDVIDSCENYRIKVLSLNISFRITIFDVCLLFPPEWRKLYREQASFSIFANPIFLRHVRTISATTCLNSKELRRFPSYSRHHIQGHSCSIPPLGELAEASIFDGMSHLENYDLYMGSWTNPPPLYVCLLSLD